MGAQNSKAEAAAKTHEEDEPLKQNNNKAKDNSGQVYKATPLSIGASASFDKMSVKIPKNTAIPTKKFESSWTTTCDNWDSMKFTFHQGERAKASENQLLGTLEVKGIPRAPRRVAKVTLSLDVDARGNLNASARDTSTGETLGRTVVPGVGVVGRLIASEEEVEVMARQGEKHESEDGEHLKKVGVMKAMEEYVIVVRENAAAGSYSNKAYFAFSGVAGKNVGRVEGEGQGVWDVRSSAT